MADTEVTIKVPAELLADLKEQGATNVIEFLEAFFRRIEAEDLIEISQDLYWDEAEEDDEWDDEDDEY